MIKKHKLLPKVIVSLLFIYILLPFFVTFVYSVFVKWDSILPSEFTLRNYVELFSNEDFYFAIIRTLILCVVSVIVTITILLIAMYATIIINPKISKIIKILCMIPYALSGVILSISIISLYSNSDTILDNRILMLFGAYTVLVLPYIYQGIENSFNSINPKLLIDAAQMLGCSSFKAYLLVVLPNIKSGIIISSLLAQSIIFGDFVLANNIAGTNYENIQVFLQRRMIKSSSLASAIVVVIFLIILIVSYIVLKLENKKEN